MNSKIRFGILGCSSISLKSTIPAILDSPYAQLQMIGSRSLRKAHNVAKKFSCKYFGDYEEVLENKNIDAVYISLPIGLHEKWATKAAKAGKHILCEKSLCLSYSSAKKIVGICKKNNLRILEGFSFRFHPQHKKIQNLIRKNSLGKIHSFTGKFGFKLLSSSTNFRFNKQLGGGSLNDVGCYMVCASRNALQKIPNSIICNLQIDEVTGVDISGNIYMTFPDNITAFGSFGYGLSFQSTYNIWGNKAIVSLERAFNIRKHMIAKIDFWKDAKIKKIKVPSCDQFKMMIDEFCREIKLPGTSQFDFENDIIIQSYIMESARKSNQKQQLIKLKSIRQF